MLVGVESTDKFDDNTLAVECSDEEFSNQALDRTIANEPLSIVQQMDGQKGFETWHAIVGRYNQRNMSEKKTACATLICNISERDTAKDVEQFDDILRTLINETNKFESRLGGKEKMLALNTLMLGSLLNCRFRKTTMSYSELLVALENIIIDKVSTVQTARKKKFDTSVPMHIGMAAKDDGKGAREEGLQRNQRQQKGASPFRSLQSAT